MAHPTVQHGLYCRRENLPAASIGRWFLTSSQESSHALQMVKFQIILMMNSSRRHHQPSHQHHHQGHHLQSRQHQLLPQDLQEQQHHPTPVYQALLPAQTCVRLGAIKVGRRKGLTLNLNNQWTSAGNTTEKIKSGPFPITSQDPLRNLPHQITPLPTFSLEMRML